MIAYGPADVTATLSSLFLKKGSAFLVPAYPFCPGRGR